MNKLLKKTLITSITVVIIFISYLVLKKIYQNLNNHQIGTEKNANFPKKENFIEIMPKKENVWVFLMAGQSNMAGRSMVSPIDTIPNSRIISINSKNKLIEAKEPFHFYEPNLTGLDCGMSFSREIVAKIPDSISIFILPTAIGRSSIEKWINDSTFRNVKLLTNFKEKVEIGKRYGIIKGILWHQGESDAGKNYMNYEKNLKILFEKFRQIVSNTELPIIIGELGSYSKYNEKWQKINDAIHSYTKTDIYSEYIITQDLKDKGDKIHFNAVSERKMGKRYADKYLDISKFAHNNVYKSLENK